ncbi:hypothetical protein E2I00_013559 [Balaenoptera physalus]|uniref:VPS9 domain-containing protein n=1 Tax=Balaenoptera physalus TaxID=9770 RepID=A0A6A1QBS1_BALPH|nr:hypothetical protein E2I00_013559 [Balaenoptera physalus]
MRLYWPDRCHFSSLGTGGIYRIPEERPLHLPGAARRSGDLQRPGRLWTAKPLMGPRAPGLGVSCVLPAGPLVEEAGETVTPDTSKMLKLAEQCLERAHRHRRVYSDEGGKLSPFLPPEIFQKLQVVESQSSKKQGQEGTSGDQSVPGLPGAWTAACHHSRELTPLEEASLQNQKLKAAYEARMARLDPSQAMQKTSLTLSLQRQMMENLVIAKAREKTVSFPSILSVQRLQLREGAGKRFCSQVALTPEDREQRALYAAILEYEQDHDWPKRWKAKLKRSPGDLSLVTSLVSHLLRKEPLLEQLKGTVQDIHDAIGEARGAGRVGDRLLSLTLLAFEGLNTAASKDRCLACIEEPFFSPLWPLLLAVYRSVHRLREAALSRSMELYGNAPPAAVGPCTRWGWGSARGRTGTRSPPPHPKPGFCDAVRALRVICACAEDYHRAREAAPQPGIAAIGADDLLPILSFVALRSGLPQLVSECAALEEFIHERYLIGEEGYCLTSLQSALSYVELLPRRALGK